MELSFVERLLRHRRGISARDVDSTRKVMTPSTQSSEAVDYVTVTDQATVVVEQTETVSEVSEVMQIVGSDSSFTSSPPSPLSSLDTAVSSISSGTSQSPLTGSSGVESITEHFLSNSTSSATTTLASRASGHGGGEVLIEDNFPFTSFAIVKAIILAAVLAILVTTTYKILWKFIVKTVNPKKNRYTDSRREHPG